LDQLAASRAQLEQAIAASDTEIERLHKKLDAADAAAIQNNKTQEQTDTTGTAPKPSPTPYPQR
jgi:septal ring factor EnvC (AmiA/AmiB activator)